MIVNMANSPTEHILIVENDQNIADSISNRVLKDAGYRISVISEAGEAISQILNETPDMVIAGFDMPGLNGLDLMVALASQKIDIPVVLVTKNLSDGNVLHAFRLGVADVIFWPAGDAEMSAVVERALIRVRERKDRDRLVQNLKNVSQELQQRSLELATVLSIGRAVSAIADRKELFEKLAEGAVYITRADLGYLLVKAGNGADLVPAAQKGFEGEPAVNLDETWDDGISSKVMASGTPIAIHSHLLKPFKIASLGQAALIVPIMLHKKAIAVWVMIRRSPVPFNSNDQRLLEGIANYTTISLLNCFAHLAAEEQDSVQRSVSPTHDLGKKISDDLVRQGRSEIFPSLETAEKALQKLMKELLPRWTTEQRQMLADVQRQLIKLRRISSAMFTVPQLDEATAGSRVNLGELINQRALSFQHLAQQNMIRFSIDLPAEPVMVQADPELIGHVLAGLLSHAIRYCSSGGQIDITLNCKPAGEAEFGLEYSLEEGADPKGSDEFFSEEAFLDEKPLRFGSLGISLPMVREIIRECRGQIRVDSSLGERVKICFTLPGSGN